MKGRGEFLSTFWDLVLCGGNHGNNSVVFVKWQKCFPYYSSGANTTAIKDFKGNTGLTKEGFLLQSETESQQTRTPQS